MTAKTLPRLGLLVLAFAVTAQAQTVLTPGHPDLMVSELSLDSQILAASVDGDMAGTIRHDVSRSGDTVTLVSTSDAQRIGMTGTVTTSMMWPSMQPIMREVEGNSDMMRYDGTTVTGTWSSGDWDPLPFDITLDAAPFAPEARAWVARALPFQEGYTATVPTFTASNRVRDYTMTVDGQEMFTRADGSMASVWAIDETREGRGARDQRYLVDAETRDLVAITYSVQGADVVIEPTTQAMLDAAAEARAMMASLRPGDGALAVDALQSYSQEFTVKLIQPQQQDIGTQSRTVTVDEAEGTVTIVSTTSIPLAGQNTSDELVLTYPGLQGMSYRLESNDVVTTLTYNDDGVISRRTPADEESPDFEQTFEEPVFDPAALFEIARLMPFEEGYSALYETFNSDGPMSIPVSVTGQEEIGGQMAWIVKVSPEGAPPNEFAIDAETRDLLRIEIAPQPGVVIQFVPADA